MSVIVTGLSIEAEIEFACDGLSMNVFDETGVESATNLGGYGNSNPLTSDATDSTITIYLPDPITLYSSISSPTVIDTYPTLGNVLDNPYNIVNTALGLPSDAVFPDGVYTATYYVTGHFNTGTFENSYTWNFINTRNVQCCLDKSGTKFKDMCCDSSNSDYINYLWQRNKLTQICAAMQCNDIDGAVALLKSLTEWCRGCGCN